jgi:hypothetical protein
MGTRFFVIAIAFPARVSDILPTQTRYKMEAALLILIRIKPS